MQVNLELYRTFYAVATENSFSKAAAKLFISQSAVSQSISALEKTLDTQLFNRSTKKVSLTSQGETLLSHIEPAINSIMKGQQQLTEYKELKRGYLHIGVSDTICKYYLIDYLKTYHELYPDIEILITNRTSIQCVELLKKNQVDLILTNLPNTAIDETMDVMPTTTFEDIIIAPSTFTDLRKKVSFKQLTGHPILLLDRQSSTTQFLQDVFTKKGLTLKPAIELGSIDLLVEMAKIGLGTTFIPDYVYRKDERLIVVDTVEKLQTRKLAIVTSNTSPVSIATTSFIDLIVDKPFQQSY